MNFSKLIFPAIISLLIVIGCQSKSNQDQTEETAKVKKSNSIEVSNAWARPADEGRNSAIYMQVFNGTGQPDTLVAVKTEIAQKAEIHESYEEDGMMGMRPAGGQSIAPDSVLKLQPGGFHIMLMNLTQSIAEDDSISLRLLFSGSENRNISIPVKLAGS